MAKLRIGKIINTRGLKGEIKVEGSTSFVKERFKVNNNIYLSSDEVNYVSYKIVRFNYVKGFIYLFLEGIDSIDKANSIREFNIYCEDTNLYEDKSTYHYLTLIDMKVIVSDKVIGIVKDIETNTRQDLLRVEANNKSFLLPFIDEFIVSVDKENKCIYMKNVEVFYED